MNKSGEQTSAEKAVAGAAPCSAYDFACSVIAEAHQLRGLTPDQKHAFYAVAYKQSTAIANGTWHQVGKRLKLAILTADEMRAVKNLAWMVKNSKQNVGLRLLDAASVVIEMKDADDNTPNTDLSVSAREKEK